MTKRGVEVMYFYLLKFSNNLILQNLTLLMIICLNYPSLDSREAHKPHTLLN